MTPRTRQSSRTQQEYRNGLEPSWCKGCSFFSVLSSVTQVLADEDLDPTRVTVVSGIGCSSRLPLYLSTFGIHTLHGRALPVAIGARLARPEIPVIVAAGDGDLFSIGIGHFVHAARKNFDMTVICMDNRMYAMTKNQASPTSASGYCGSLTPYGKLSVPLNVIEFAIASDATFVSRTFAGDPTHLRESIAAAFRHKGFSFVEVIAPCRTFDKVSTLASLRERMIDINRELAHDPRDKSAAVARAEAALDHDSNPSVRVPVGVFWTKDAPTFEDRVTGVKNSYGKSVRSLEQYLKELKV